jgi:phosphatidate cytidylyltransferase
VNEPLGCGAYQRPHEAQTADHQSSTGRSLDIRRLYVALAFIPLFYLLVRYLPPIVFFVLVLVIMVSALAEFYRLYFRDRPNKSTITFGLASACVLAVSLHWPGIMPESSALVLITSVVLISRLLSPHDLPRNMADAGVLLFGVLYVGLMLGHLLLMRALPGGVFLILFVVLVTWACDTGAYYAGMIFGQRKLAPLISPNKTVEGLAGGLLLGVGAAFAGGAWFLPSFTVTDCLATGFLLSVAGILGDLSESALKRSAGVKDSGDVLPGHGGMLDRLDSLLFTAPAFYYYVTLAKA